ncbi:unnamed protein product, partial [marine sediment metagenome]
DLPEQISSGTRWLLQRCLAKDPKTRLRDVGEARVAMEYSSDWLPTVAESSAGVTDSPGRPRWLLPVLGMTLIVAAFLLGALLRPSSPSDTIPLRKFEISRDAVHRNFDNPPVLSPDGQRIAYVHDNGIWVRDFARLEARQIVPEGDSPFWSADGRQIAYDDDEKLWRIEINGGEPALICELPERGSIISGAWTEDGTVWIAAWRGGLYRVSYRGGVPELAVENQAHEIDFHDIALLPDGNGVMFVNHQRDPEDEQWIQDSEVFVFRDGQRRKLEVESTTARMRKPVYSQGHLLFERTDAGEGIWAIPFSPSTLETTGEPFLVVTSAVQPSVADDGTLTYLPTTGDNALPE